MTLGPPAIPDFEYRGDIGAGGFATVHRYYDGKLKDDVAVKVPQTTGLSDEVRERFLAEGESMAKLRKHRNVVTVYGTGTAVDGRPYLVMEYCPGGDLAKMASRMPLSVKQVLDIGVQIAGALETAHGRGMLHRDIKPANVLMNESGDACLTDFGIAGRLADRGRETQVALSPPWSAPELFGVDAVARYGVRTEVFSFAATLWHLLVGRSPFMPLGTDHSVEAVQHRIVSGWRPDQLAAPDELRRLLLRAMDQDPAARPGSLLDFAAELQRIQVTYRFGRTELVLMPGTVPERHPVRTAGVPSFAPPAPRTAPPTRQRVPPTAPRAPHTLVRQGNPQPATIVREPASAPRPTPAEHVERVRWPLYAAGAAAAVAIIGVGVFLLSGGEEPATGPAPATVVDDVPDQNAGAGSAPPGRPVITAMRVDAGTVRFEWSYSAQQATDTFSWRTSDGARTGVEKAPKVVVEGANPVCLQVKVVRADGSNATADWSQESCG
ncbi:protein kinase [Lentzea sp. NPDC042327]|uniref:serine/threonine-protein kinase n=1 Tax=Lentzea sp. NPDC042327 TaxID=3154801 RepID=UPI0033D835D3